MRRIRLGRSGQYALIDDEDMALISEHFWFLSKPRKGNRTAYAFTRIDGHNVFMHRLIMEAEPGQIVDHINRNGLDNTRSNLRFVDYAQSARNTGPRHDSQSGFKGVYETDKGKWKARISTSEDGIKIVVHLGPFDDEISAAMGYDKYIKKMFGESTFLNFPEDKDHLFSSRNRCG